MKQTVIESLCSPVTRICCIGAGYVGGPSSAVLALKSPDIMVTVVDSDPNKIDAWMSSVLPVYEPGLDAVVNEVRGKNLVFSHDIAGAINDSQMIFISVNTPTKEFGLGEGRAADLTNLEIVARLIAKHALGSKIVVEKSTVPVRSAQSILKILRENSNGYRHQVLSNPEFLSEGNAVRDLTNPDRVLIGGDEDTEEGRLAINALRDVYLRWVSPDKILTMSTWSSELSKLAANAFLAQRITSINAIGSICEETGAEVGQVSRAVGADSRLGPNFLQASLGFGGSCFQKDILSLVYLSETLGLNQVASYFSAILKMNDYTKSRFCQQIIESLFNTVRGKKIAILGFAFKANTGDTRCSPAIHVAKTLLSDGALLRIYDPKVSESQMRRDLNHPSISQDSIVFCDDEYEACRGTHAFVVCTEWPQFRLLDFQRIYRSMDKPAYVFDGRRILDIPSLTSIGFHCEAVGRRTMKIEHIM